MVRLKSPTDIRRFLAKISNMLLNREIETKRANAIVVACNVLLSAIRTDEQERKLQELEAMIEDLTQE